MKGLDVDKIGRVFKLVFFWRSYDAFSMDGFLNNNLPLKMFIFETYSAGVDCWALM